MACKDLLGVDEKEPAKKIFNSFYHAYKVFKVWTDGLKSGKVR
jgi:hypothetical protein